LIGDGGPNGRDDRAVGVGSGGLEGFLGVFADADNGQGGSATFASPIASKVLDSASRPKSSAWLFAMLATSMPA
jgi:hypothetical protein